MKLCDCPICSEKDCKVCLEPQYCECNCGTCEDAKSILFDEIMDKLTEDCGVNTENSFNTPPDETECHEMFLENLNDIEKDGK